MADFNSSLPIRTEDNGDAVIKICDGTTNTQILAIDANGKISANVEQSVAANLNATVVANDLDIRDISNAQDDILVYGFDGTTNRKIATNSSGNLDIVSTSGLNVTATDLDIRNIVNTQDDILVYGFDGTTNRKIKTNADGNIDIVSTSGINVKQLVGDVWEVHISESGAGDEIHHYNTAVNVASGASNTHTYTVTSGKTLYLNQVWASASGKIRIEIKTGTIGAETTKLVGFSSTSDPNIDVQFKVALVVPDTDAVLVVRKNMDKTAQDIYSTIIGLEK